MIRSALRPLARQARTFASSSSSTTTTFSATSSARSRNLVIAGTTLAVAGLAISQRSPVLNEASDAKPNVPRESVLDAGSLKVPIHRRDGDEKDNSEAPAIVQKKSVEAEESSGSQGAFNEETGEINWDCPCLGGMADGPCGEDFKSAFSCFIYSEAEPKGMDCVDKFKAMQDCFRKHPEIYGEEIDDDSEPVGEGAAYAKDNNLPTDETNVPKPPNKDPPPNSPILAVTPETTPSKGTTKIQPKAGRADKGGLKGPSGDGTV